MRVQLRGLGGAHVLVSTEPENAGDPKKIPWLNRLEI